MLEDAKNHDVIVHVLEKDLDVEEGASVKGVIDWNRRMDHMQQHHGQHILSKAFIDVSNFSCPSPFRILASIPILAKHFRALFIII